MMTLDDAWKWYLTTRSQLQLFGRLGKKYWASLPWEGMLAKDDKFKALEADAIFADATFCLEHLDDFAILILFSVFESSVRDRVLSDVQDERYRLSNALVAQIVDDAIRDIEQGGFFRILEVFKSRDADLVEEVNQVRRYRNWVAHGRRTAQPDVVDPETAYRRLKRFLDDVIGPTPAVKPS
jgi:hypothetical protein